MLNFGGCNWLTYGRAFLNKDCWAMMKMYTTLNIDGLFTTPVNLGENHGPLTINKPPKMGVGC